MRSRRKTILPGLALIMLITTHGCQNAEIPSQPRDVTVSIDADKNDWEGKDLYLIEDTIVLGVMNDERDLYLYLSSVERDLILNAIQLGLTIWFGPVDEEREMIGIKFPVGAPDPVESRDIGIPEAQSWDRTIRNMRMLLDAQREILIVNEDREEICRIPLVNETGIRLETSLSEEGQFVYEMKIPLGTNDPTASLITAGALPGEKVKLGFETDAIDFSMGSGDRERPERSGFGTGGPPEGPGPPGGGMRPPGGGTGRKPGGRGVEPPVMKPVELWTTIVLFHEGSRNE